MKSTAFKGNSIPNYIRIFVWIQIPLRLLIALAFYFNPSIFFPDFNFTDEGMLVGFAMTGSRQIAVFSFLLLSMLTKDSRTLAIAIFGGFLVEAQDFFIFLQHSNNLLNTVGIALFAIIQLVFATILFRLSRKE